MTKYRIVSGEDAHGLKYFAQTRFLWFFWGDCTELKNSPSFLAFQFENPSRNLQLVENYITFSKNVDEIIKNPLPKNQKVVKVY